MAPLLKTAVCAQPSAEPSTTETAVSDTNHMIHPLLYLLLIISSVPTLLAADSWATPSSERTLAIRAQRDVSANITIDQLSLTGVDISSTIFAEEGYTIDALTRVEDALTLGVAVLAVDLYWHEQLRKFQLCPVPMSSSSSLTNNTGTFKDSDGNSYTCQTTLKVTDLMQTISDFLTDTDTNLNGNIIVLILRLLSVSDSSTSVTSSSVGTSNDTLTSVLNNYFETRLYKPSSLESDRTTGIAYNSIGESSTGWPTLSHFLFDEKMRILAGVWETKLPSNTTCDTSLHESYVFNSSYFKNTVFLQDIKSPSNHTATSLEQWRFAVDSQNQEFEEDTFETAISYGYSPILNHTIITLSEDLPTFLNSSLWSWESSQPLTESDAKKKAEKEGESSTQAAYSCASLSIESLKWRVANCYSEKPVACRLKNSTSWVLSLNTQSYFHADDACSSLADDQYISTTTATVNSSTRYEFSVPKTALEQNELASLLTSANISYEDVWIDMNSIAVSDCWVTGGPYASCPYQRVSSHRNFVQMLTPAAVFCGVVLGGIVCLRLRKVPIQDNRKHWKKLINQYADNEYEGVPS